MKYESVRKVVFSYKDKRYDTSLKENKVTQIGGGKSTPPFEHITYAPDQEALSYLYHTGNTAVQKNEEKEPMVEIVNNYSIDIEESDVVEDDIVTVNKSRKKWTQEKNSKTT